MGVKLGLFIKNIHNWLGLGSAVFLIALLSTGILLNHPMALIPGQRGQVLSLAADPSDARRVYRGAWSSLERSEDGGAGWAEVPMLYAPQEVVDIVFHPTNPRTIYALQRWEGILMSTDGGSVWETVPLDFDPAESGVELSRLSVSRDGGLLLQTSAGLLRKQDAASGWQSVDFNRERKNWAVIIRRLHSGHFFGEWFPKVYDASSAALLLLIVTGVVLWRIRSS